MEKDKKSPSSSEADNKLTNLVSDGHVNWGDDADHRIRHRSWEDMNSDYFLQR